MGLYGPFIMGISLVLLISSSSLIYLAGFLINFYLLPTLGFVSIYFSFMPHVMLSVGALGVLASLFSLFVGAVPSRPALAANAVLFSLLFILQLASTFSASELRSEMEHEQILNRGDFDLVDLTISYFRSSASKSSIDTLHRTYGCCGFMKMNTGYKDWVHGEKSKSDVPDSCCLEEHEGCGVGVARSIDPHLQIFTHGCLPIVENRLKRDVQPVLLAYFICSVVLAFLQLIIIVLCSAYCAALSRSKKPVPSYSSSSSSQQQMPKVYTFDSGVHNSLDSRKSGQMGMPGQMGLPGQMGVLGQMGDRLSYTSRGGAHYQGGTLNMAEKSDEIGLAV